MTGGPQRRDADSGPISGPISERRSVRWLDGLVDSSVAAFAAWTVAYHVSLVLRLDRIVAVVLFGLLLAGFAFAWSRLRVGGADVGNATRVPGPAVGLVAVAAIAGGVAVAGRSKLFWGFAFLAVAGALLWAGRVSLPASPGRGLLERIEVPGVLTLAGGMAVLTLITRTPAGDNTYYLNRALYVSQRSGAFPVRDTVFSDQVFPSVAPADTIASLEALIGTVAAYLPFDVRTLYFLVFPAIVAVLGVLALWRLTRSGRANAPIVATGAAVLFVLLQSAQSGWGGVVVRRLFWGKAMLIALAVPFLWHHASAFARTGSRRSLTWTAIGAVATLGFSSSGTFIAALVIAAAMASLPLFPPDGMSRAAGLRRAAIGSTAAAYPLLAGAAGSFAMRDLGISYRFRNHDSLSVWKQVSGAGPELFLITVVVVVGWLAIRSRHLRLGVGFGVAAVLALFSPVGLDLVTKLGAGSIGSRLLWAIPVPFLVGAVVDAPLQMRSRSLRWAGLVVAVVVLVAATGGGGRPVLSNRADGAFTRPQWDFEPVALGSARELIRLAGGAGVVAAPDKVSMIVPNLSLSVFASSPRIGYTKNLAPVAGRRFRGRDRLLLLNAVEGRIQVEPRRLASALRALEVEVACARINTQDALEPGFERAGFTLVGGDELCMYWQRS